jgi:prepilin-type processing-associated H-X9-DG protein
MPRRGFTLIELLLILSLMTLLAAFLAPVLASARESGRRSTCLSNLRQIAMAHQLYVQDADERFPDWIQDRPPRAPSWRRYFFWPEYLGPYMGDGALLRDPSFTLLPDEPLRGQKLADYALLTWGPFGRGTRERPYYRWAGPTITIGQVVRPSETFLATDGWTTTVHSRGFYVTPHSGGMNAAFLDGRVQWVPRGVCWRIDRDGAGFHYYHYATADR